MCQAFELWDIETGNVVGQFPSTEDALKVVKILLDANGVELAETLVLQCRDETEGVFSVGSGSELVELVMPRTRRR